MNSSATTPATRLLTQAWRRPRLWVGLVLVLGSALIGGLVFASVTEEASYWALADDVQAGEPVRAGDLVAVDAHLDADTSATVWSATDEIPADAVWALDLPKGSLVPSTATIDNSARGHQVPVSADAGSCPPGLSAGDSVDIWVGPGTDDSTGGPAELVLARVQVVSVKTLGLDRYSVVVTVPEAPTEQTIGDLSARHVTIVAVT